MKLKGNILKFLFQLGELWDIYIYIYIYINADACECGNEHSVSVKCEEFLD